MDSHNVGESRKPRSLTETEEVDGRLGKNNLKKDWMRILKV